MWARQLGAFLLPSLAQLSLSDRPAEAPTGTRGPRTRKDKKDDEALDELADQGQQELDLYSEENMAPEHRDPHDADVVDLVELTELTDEDLANLAPTPEAPFDVSNAAQFVRSKAFQDEVRQWMARHLESKGNTNSRRGIRSSKERKAKAMAEKYGLTVHQVMIGIERITTNHKEWQQRFGRSVHVERPLSPKDERPKERTRRPSEARGFVPNEQRFDNGFARLMRSLGGMRKKDSLDGRHKESMYSKWHEYTEKITPGVVEGEDKAYVNAYRLVKRVVERSEAAYAAGGKRAPNKSDEETKAAWLLASPEGDAFLRRLRERVEGGSSSSSST